MERRYDRWAGNPEGEKENPNNCIKEVADSTGWHFYQCKRKRINGLYCKQHTPKEVD